MVMLFTIIIIGYLVKKAGFVSLDFQKKLSTFILEVTMPLLILSSAFKADTTGAGERIPMTFLIAATVFAVLPFAGKLIARIIRSPRNQYNIYEFMTIFSNVSFMGFPVISAIFGVDALIYAVVFNLIFSLVQFTYGVMLFKGEKLTFDPKVFMTPVIISSILGLIIFIAGFNIGGPVVQAFSSVGNITTPLSMLVIGFSLSDIPLRDAFTDARVYVFTLIKQVILPIVAYFILRIFVKDELILGVSVIIIAMPVAAMTVILANQYDHYTDIATKGVFLTTLASVITIPLITYLLPF